MLQNKTKSRQHEVGLVSVIVPTMNSSSTLAATLTSIASQTHDNLEIIVVDNYSTDNTMEIATQYTDKVFTYGPERTAQLNFGIKQAHGKYVYRVDSDFILNETVVAEAVQKCENEGCAAIIIHNSSDDSVSFWSRVRRLERDMYKDDMLNVATRFIRKDVLDKVGLFDESMVAGEDYDLHNRIVASNYKVGSISAQEMHVGEPKTLMEIAKKHYYYGKTFKTFIQKNKGRGVKQLMPIRPAYLRHWKQFAKHPHLTLGFIVYQLTRYFAAALGYVVASRQDHKPRLTHTETDALAS